MNRNNELELMSKSIPYILSEKQVYEKRGNLKNLKSKSLNFSKNSVT